MFDERQMSYWSVCNTKVMISEIVLYLMFNKINKTTCDGENVFKAQ